MNRIGKKPKPQQLKKKIDSLGSFFSLNATNRDRIKLIPKMFFWIFLNVNIINK